MSEKEPDQGGLARAIAGLEAADAQLALLVPPGTDETGSGQQIIRARGFVADAIRALSLAGKGRSDAVMVPSKEPATKRRVKIKAESQVTPSEAPIRPNGRGKAAKSSARQGDQMPATPPPLPTGAVSKGSLLARLGAATHESVSTLSIAASEAAPSESMTIPPSSRSALAETPGDTEGEASTEAPVPVEDAVTRLARLEAEIADLTEAPRAYDSPRTVTADATHQASGEETEDEDTELVIIGPDGTVSTADPALSRGTPRVFRDTPIRGEDEAEVEIVRGGEKAASSDAGKASLSGLGRREPLLPIKSTGNAVARSRWRLFRGSS